MTEKDINKSDPHNDVVEPEHTLPPLRREDLSPEAQAAVERAGWKDLLPVQEKTVPYILARRDLMIQSRTGSGKTGAFILPLLERIDPRLKYCQALVLVPTRELARQVAREAEILSGEGGFRVVPVYGGVSYTPQLEAFQAGAHLVVGTPGRILDHLMKKNLILKNLRVLVFDEADRMLSMGFYPDMRRIQGFLSSTRPNGYMFSATFPPYVMRLARHFLHQPEFLSLSRDHVHVTDTDHIYYFVPAMEKDRCLIRIIEMINPASAIIFCNTKSKVHFVNVVLQRFGYDADELTSDLSQDAREKVLRRVRRGKLRLLVATDVASRGIDIPHLSHVILYEPPEEREAYIHRAGRTGRVGARGVAISLVSGTEEMQLKRIARRYEIDLIERKVPSPEQVEGIVSERATAMLEAKLRDRDKLQVERMRRFIPMARELAASEDELSLISMLLDDYYQQILHAPLHPPEKKEKPAEKRAEPRFRPPRRERSPRRGSPRRRR